jgi:hypothetical protein
MKVIIAGSRRLNSISAVNFGMDRIIVRFGPVTEVISGLARGADTLGLQWAVEHNVPVAKFPALWDKHGKSAGFIRNKLMAQHGDVLLAISINNSPGTEHMIRTMKELGKPVLAYYYTADGVGLRFLNVEFTRAQPVDSCA